jgi:hypothetical protein
MRTRSPVVAPSSSCAMNFEVRRTYVDTSDAAPIDRRDDDGLLHLVGRNSAHLLDAISAAAPGGAVSRGRSRSGAGRRFRGRLRLWRCRHRLRDTRFSRRSGSSVAGTVAGFNARRRVCLLFRFLSSKHLVYSVRTLPSCFSVRTPPACFTWQHSGECEPLTPYRPAFLAGAFPS